MVKEADLQPIGTGFDPYGGAIRMGAWVQSTVGFCQELTKLIFSQKALVFTCLQYKSFENSKGKGEIVHNEQFLLLPLCFLLIWRTFWCFHSVWNCRLQTLSGCKSLKFVVWERVKKIPFFNIPLRQWLKRRIYNPSVLGLTLTAAPFAWEHPRAKYYSKTLTSFRD